MVTVVSRVLGEAISKKFSINYVIIPNVVNTSIFFPTVRTSHQKIKFIHISSLGYQKNLEQIIEATAMVKEKNFDFSLTIFGPSDHTLDHLIKSFDLSSYVDLKGEVPQVMLADTIRKSDALILYSRYETFGCVVIEANACGIPAILSDLPVFREYSIENETAIFAQPGHPSQLARAMINFIENKNSFDPERITAHVESNFSYTRVGHQFNDLYQKIPGSASIQTK
jgi:glycosyltransferase involved in cell wall biosynthesis